MFGRTSVSITSGGSVVSMRLKKSVHEKTRWSMSRLASRAAAATSSSICGLTDRWISAICAKTSAAVVSRPSRRPSVSSVLRRESSTDPVDLEREHHETDHSHHAEHDMDRALVVEGSGGEIGAEHGLLCPCFGR